MGEDTGAKHGNWLWRPELGSITVSVLTALYLLVVSNQSFWSKGWLYLEGRPTTFASIAIGIAFLYIAFCVAVSVKYVMKPIFVFLILASAAGAWFMDQFGVVIDIEMIRNAAETNSAEAGHMITPGFMLHMLAFGVLPSLLLVWVRVRHRPFLWKVRGNLAVIVPALVIALVAGLSHARVYAAAVRAHHDWFEALNPFVPMVTAVQFAVGESGDVNIVAAPLGEDARVGDVPLSERKPRLMVVVAGETARADNFSLGGYGRDTNPELAKRDIYYFPETTSCGTATAVSLPCMFSVFTRAAYSHRKGLETQNLLDVLSHAGVKVEWWDNNTGSKKIAARVKERSVIKDGNPRHCGNGECRDEVLLEDLDAWIGSVKTDTVLVLHQIGSHGPAYSQRYPEEFRRFKPDCRSAEFSDCSREEIVNAYDNTIAYTDHILAGVIDRLVGQEDRLDVSMLYMSDHGESLGEFGLYLHGAPYMIAPPQQTHVPFVLWLGKDAKAAYSADCLADETRRPQSHDNLFHSVLGMMRVETRVRDPALDLVSACRLGATS
ncbi:phosphoethanolamine--lipid A transferase [Shinella curvata]|uniref:Phosphoethanolamine--lipid A transferase n=1 Tax=Shinella curvata TaxID=1817964 RepID=A0ABT8X776_9HYPH|nr:phosphoethanolamine--lipid A transferase [Shinella curvata]MCJ8052488.1 phosphoethanolamine--lipid A transferase [Shinella curvata]MDO6119563.1 phosphoethanolamine--lipid A transferase [Shinella curvata]